MDVPFFLPNFDENEEEALLETLRSGWISTGPRTEAFEQKFASLLGADTAVAVTNGTAALHLALVSLGVGKGDEVIVPSLSFAATASCVLMAGATPVFADIVSDEEWTLSPGHVRALLNERTRAIIPMHYGGFPARMEELMQLATENDLLVVEDACHGPACSLKGQSLGTWGHAGCFSFYTNKNFTCGEGGMILFPNAEYADRARKLRSHGMDRNLAERTKSGFGYTIDEWGFNYRMDDLRASLGLVQLEKLEAENKKRRRLAQVYAEELENVTGLTLPFQGYQPPSAFHLAPVLLPPGTDRARVAEYLRDKQVGSSMHYPPIHQFPGFQAWARDTLSCTDRVAERELTLPLHARLTEEQVHYAAYSLKEALRR